MKFRVAISKAYFPNFPKQEVAGEYYNSWIVKAESRIEAAHLVWSQHGESLLKEMKLYGHDPKRVSLYVSGENAIGPNSKSKNYAGRMPPITIWKKNGNEQPSSRL